MTSEAEFFLAARSALDGQQASHHERHFLLIDHAGAPGLIAELRRRSGVSWWNLFDDSKEHGALDVAPILIQLREDRSTADERGFLSWVHRACKFSTSVIVLHSTWTPEPLVAALKRRLDVLLPDRMPVMLRYFDTRIFESLLQVLSEPQCEQFVGVGSCWYWLDRAGQLQTRASRQLETDAWPQQFELDVAQQNALIEAGSADALVEQMTTQAPDMCRGQTRAELHAVASRCLPKFAELHIEDNRTQTVYCLAALQLGAAFESQPEWAAILKRVAGKTLTFEGALKEMRV